MISNQLVTDYIEYGDVSIFLASDDYQKQRYYGWKDETQKVRVIYLVNSVLKWGQPFLVGTIGYDKVATYLYALIGQFLLEAAHIANTGTGLVIGTPVIPVATPGAAGAVTVTVGAIGSPIAANTNTYTNISFINRTVIVILDNIVLQTSGTAVTFSLNSVTGTLTFSANLSVNQVLTVIFI